jgi:hypothetical protein
MYNNKITNKTTTVRSFTGKYSNNYHGRFSFHAKIIPELIRKAMPTGFCRGKKINK